MMVCVAVWHICSPGLSVSFPEWLLLYNISSPFHGWNTVTQQLTDTGTMCLWLSVCINICDFTGL